ncbi:protein of unknown function [Bradyrhizobium vignae]|uniref:HTH araC/xylS-type domain-containing protein n=1 Tax=Bradyrhizobium vignae TaxID=1549949 RepID=A0A2U3QCL4_9BRAD|nr:protein of unknown function [Bradyrhizobium vignae]
MAGELVKRGWPYPARLSRAHRAQRGLPSPETRSFAGGQRAAAGFCDQAALNKHFRRCYGITPLRFGQAARAG